MRARNFIAVLSIFAVVQLAGSGRGFAASAAEEYDRLDGMGASGKKVNVIEWEGNLEVHVYPAGSLKGLSLKLDKRNKLRPVMVIGYRFDSDPSKQLIRRAILGIDLAEGFKAYRDPSAGSEYDKIIISNNGLSGDMIAYHLDPAPAQLYPDGHPALAQGPDGGKDGYQGGASNAAGSMGGSVRGPASPVQKTQAAKPAQVDDAGTIQPFFMGGGAGAGAAVGAGHN